MHRISPNNPVRRRLFTDEDLADQATIDNFANVLQESAVNEKEEKKRKWNFDFENEVPLEGIYEWTRCDGANDWIGVRPDTKLEEEEAKEQDSFLPKKLENEATPKPKKEEGSAPLIRKRRKDDLDSATDKGAKRRISFE